MDKSNRDQLSILKSKIFEISGIDSQTAFIRWLFIAGSTFVTPMYVFLGAEIHELILLIILFFSNGLVSIPIYYLISESGLIKAHEFPIFNGIDFPKNKLEIPIMVKLQTSILISVLYPVIIFSTFILYSVLNLIDLSDIFIGFIILVLASIWASLFSSYQLSRNIKTVSVSINKNLSELSKFSGDLTKNIASFSNDEFGKMSQHFNKFILSLRRMIYRIRELADEITESLNTITKNIHNSKEAIEITANFFNKIIDGINDLSYDMKEIKNNMNGLNSNSEYITKLLSELLDITEVVNTSVKDIDKKETQISSSVSNIKNISSQLYSAIEEISSGINQISNTAQFLSESGTHNAEIVQNLENLVGKFILDEKTLHITDK